jgi:hypothetical protein
VRLFRNLDVLDIRTGFFHKVEKGRKGSLFTNTYSKVKFFVFYSNIYEEINNIKKIITNGNTS